MAMQITIGELDARAGARAEEASDTNPRGYGGNAQSETADARAKNQGTPPSKNISSVSEVALSEKNISSISDDNTTLSVPVVRENRTTDDDNFESSEEFLAFPVIPKNIQWLPGTNMLAGVKKIFSKKNLTPALAKALAFRLVEYFARPTDGFYVETVYLKDQEPHEVEKPYHLPLPLLAEFANLHGMTEREMKQLGELYPDTFGRALEFAKDVVKTNLVRKGLSGEYNPQITTLTATNETDMKLKTETTHRTINVNELLDKIEKASKPIAYDVSNENERENDTDLNADTANTNTESAS